MKLPMSWLKDYVDIDVTPKEYADAMTMSGSKVEGIENMGENIDNVVVGKILTIEKHPNADKLVVCKVDIGDEVLQIVTGASNMVEKDYIALAKHGSKLPGGISIKKGKLRGVESQGMMCSIEELGLDKENYPDSAEDGIYVLKDEFPLGLDIKDVFGLNENIIEFEITSNRPDCLSVLGLARETAVTFDKPFKVQDVKVIQSDEDIKDYADVEVTATDLCPRYAARVVKDIKIEPSPSWLQQRLTACGIRPINNIVDITNYVLLEYGQPMHAFDLANIEGEKIIVRKAKKDETINTLDDQKRKLDEDMLVIADTQKPIAIAGVMGGEKSEVTEDTTTILFESANFLGSSVRATSKKLGLRTESSARFEKGLDVNNVVTALDRACELITQLNAGIVVGGIIDVNNSNESNVRLNFRPDKINSFLGTKISQNCMVDILEKLYFKIDLDNMIVKVPTFRADIEGEADLAEEIARIYGYDKIESTLLSGETTQGKRNYKQNLEDKIKESLSGQGLYEIITYSFMNPNVFDDLNMDKNSELRKTVVISNPLGEENSLMRTTTLPAMLDVMRRNYNRRIEEVKFFELGTIYIPQQVPVTQLPQEKIVVTMGMYGGVDFYDIKGVVEELLCSLGIKQYEFDAEKDNPSFHPGRTAKIFVNRKEVGILGEIHPDVTDNYHISTSCYVAMLDLNLLLENAKLVADYKPLPKYPAVTRDIAVLVKDEITVKQIEDIIRGRSGKLLEDIKLFDVYKGKQTPEGMKSVAYAITFRAEERTLTDEDVNKVFSKIVVDLESNLKAQLRQ